MGSAGLMSHSETLSRGSRLDEVLCSCRVTVATFAGLPASDKEQTAVNALMGNARRNWRCVRPTALAPKGVGV
jgi:hypothetical protein